MLNKLRQFIVTNPKLTLALDVLLITLVCGLLKANIYLTLSVIVIYISVVFYKFGFLFKNKSE